jgi:hypothetical protein
MYSGVNDGRNQIRPPLHPGWQVAINLPEMLQDSLLRTPVKELPCLCEFRTVWISRFPERQELLVPLFGCLAVAQSLRGARQAKDRFGAIWSPK